MPTYLSMPDPCPHITRMDLIAAKLGPDYELDKILDHLDNCPGEDDGYTVLDRLPALEAMSSYANDLEVFHDDPGMAGPEL
jgi:hypothetical protein